MQLADAIPERVEAVAGRLNDDLPFAFLLDAAFPTVDRLHRREQVDARGETLAEQGAAEGRPVRVGGQRGHHHNIFNTHRLHPQFQRPDVAPYYRLLVRTKVLYKGCPEIDACDPETLCPRLRRPREPSRSGARVWHLSARADPCGGER